MRRYLFIACGLCTIMSCALAQAGTKPDPGSPAVAADGKEANQYERLGRFIYAFHRTGISRERLADPLIARRAPPDLARRAAELADKYDAIVAKGGIVPDAEVRATLRAAEEVGAAIREWWNGQAE